MKKILSILVIAFALLSNNVLQAQDAFFSYSVNDDNREGSGINNRIVVPNSHELLKNQNADPAPLGSGLLILTSLGIGYVSLKKNRSK
jgi:hypothetical protein